jgi:tetratricopeptide (TPR) repeat protein
MLGRPLYRPALPPAEELRLQAAIDSATAAFRDQPGDADALLLVGRRLAEARHYRDAIAAFTRGIRMFPNDPRFYHLRGQAHITCRQFDLASGDLERAAALTERRPGAARAGADQQRASILYYLGLAHFLRRDLPRAADYWQQALSAARDRPLAGAAAEWLYLAQLRSGRPDEAAATLRELERRGSDDTRARLRWYRGELPADTPPPGDGAEHAYAIATWYLANGERGRGLQLLRQLLASPHWQEIGYVAAETELGEFLR